MIRTLRNANIGAFIVYIKENDRSKQLIEDLRSLKLPYEKVLSLSRFHDESELLKLHLGEDLYELTIGRNLLLPEIGAHVGHHRARLAFLKSNHEFGLILDDDARLEVTPVKLFMNMPRTRAFCLSLSKNIDGIPRIFGVGNLFQALHTPSTMSAHAYILNRAAAHKFAQQFNRDGVTSVTDWPYPLPRLRFYISKENNFSQENSRETYSVAKERDYISTIGTKHALSMPITLISLAKRIADLNSYNFKLSSLLRHELLLRFRTRRFLAIRKIRRFLLA